MRWNYAIFRPRGEGSAWTRHRDALKQAGAHYFALRKCWLYEGPESDIPRETATFHGRLVLGQPAADLADDVLARQIDGRADWMRDRR